MAFLVNIDNGGSFTDAIATDGERVLHAKSSTTPHDLSQCFIAVLERLALECYGETDLARLLGETEYLRYSTTSGTNAVVEHKGTPVGVMVLTGEEHRLYGAADSLGGTGLWRAMVPSPVVGLRFDGGAVDATGLMASVSQLISQGVSRIVVALPEPAQEQRVKDEVLERYPRHLLGAIPVLFSHELVRDDDHGRRLFSAVVNSYLHPGMELFLYGAERVTRQHHLGSPLLIYRNDGDSARVAKTTAIKTYGSGPRGGLQFELGQPGELYMITQGGGGGYGDVLERDPVDIVRDWRDGIVSRRVIEAMYHVVMNYDTGAVDLEATARARAEERKRRLARAVPFKEFAARWTQALPPAHLPYYGSWDDPTVLHLGSPARTCPADAIQAVMMPDPKDVEIERLQAELETLRARLA